MAHEYSLFESTRNPNMIVSKEIHSLIDQYKTYCNQPRCQTEWANIRHSLLNCLASNKIIDFDYIGEYELNPGSVHIRPTYAIKHKNGTEMKIAFTWLSNIVVFSSRNRKTHCYADEFKKRLDRFVNV